jgi:Flp pilus assembly protein TadB
MKRRTSQGGSVASFVVIGVILVVGLSSAIYFLNQRGQQVRKDQTAVADNKTQTPKNKATDTTTTKSATGTTSNNSTSQTTKSETSALPASGNEGSIANIVSVFLLSTTFIAFLMSLRFPERSL